MARTRWILIIMFIAAIGVRVLNITQPFVDRWSWRQSDVASIARNYSTNGYRFAYPQVDWAGNEAGYVGTEFPLLPFAAALAYRIFGVHEWIGRGQSLLFFALGLPFFYLLVRDLFRRDIALWATFFYSFAPLSITASRAFMPDIPSLSLAITGTWMFSRWLTDRRHPWFLISAGTLSLAILIKAPTAIIGAPLLYLGAERLGWRMLRDPKMWLFAAIALLPSAMWYVHANHIASTFYPHHFFGAGGFGLRDARWYTRIFQLTATASLTIPLVTLAVFGGLLRQRGHSFFSWWAGTMVLFIFTVGYGNRHPWYQLPLVPIAAAFAGVACVWLARRVHLALPAAIATLFSASALTATRWFEEPTAAPLRELGLQARALAEPGALLVAADDGDPTIFYYAECKGWHFLENGGVFYGNPYDDAQLIDDLEQLRARGATFLVLPFGQRWWVDYYRDFGRHLANTASVVQLDERSAIYRLHPK